MRKEQIVDKITKVVRDAKMRIKGYTFLTNEYRTTLQEHVHANSDENSRSPYFRVLTRAEKIAEDLCLPSKNVRFETAYDSKDKKIPSMQAVFVKR